MKLEDVGNRLKELAEAVIGNEDLKADGDDATLERLEEYLGVLTGFADAEIDELSRSELDGLMAMIDAMTEETDEKAGGHGGHGGAHAGHGGTSSGMGPIAKRAARKRVMGKLEANRGALLTDIRTMRTMKLGSPDSEGARRMLIKDAQADLAGVRKKMVAARAKYKATEFDLVWAQKAEWSIAMMNDLPDSSFLFIESGGEKDSDGKTVPRSKRHFPYKNAAGEVDLPHLRNAIARIPQSNAPGLDKEALQKRAQMMLERMNQGKKAMSESDMRAMMKRVAADMDMMLTAEQMDSMMESMSDMADAEPEAVEQTMRGRMARMGSKSAVRIYKDKAGGYRWFGWVSNHFRDNDNPREIISGKAHKEFVEWADREGKYPELWLWHVPGSKVGRADWLEFADGFLMSSGTFDKGMESVAERLAATDETLLMSHGFRRVKHDEKAVITDAYRMFEESFLPVGAEANPWTLFTVKETDMPISDAKKAFLSKFLDADTIAKLEGDTDTLRKAAEAAGVDWKEVEEAETPADASTEAAPNTTLDVAALTESVANAIVERLQMKALSEMVADIKATSDGMPQIVSRLDALEATVKGLKADDDTKMAQKLAPKMTEVFTWANYRASGNKETVLDETKPEDEKLKQAQPSAFEAFVLGAVNGNGQSAG